MTIKVGDKLPDGRLWELPVDIRISGQASKLKLSPRAYTHLGSLPLLAVFDRPLTGWASSLKSVLDRSLAALLIVLLSPVLLAGSLVVRLDSKGPILFKERRYGFNNALIEIYNSAPCMPIRAMPTRNAW